MKYFYIVFIIFVSVESRIWNVDPNLERTSQCSDQNHVFLVPGVLASGSSNRGCLSRMGTSSRGAARLQVLLPRWGTLSPSIDLPPGDGGCIDFIVPTSARNKADLVVQVRYAEWNCTWEKHLSARVLGTRVVLVQTERPRYRPGEVLRVRILQMRADLTPPHAPLEEVWVEGPRGIWGDGIRVMQWSRVRTRLGVGQLQYTLDGQAPPGQWTVRAKSTDGSQGSATFLVGDYQLPPFQLSVRHSATILRSSERLVWTVCVRYPWGEAVEGLLVVRLRGAGSGVRTVVRARAPRACHRHAVAAWRVGLDRGDPPQVIVADFSFQEDGTRVWQNTTVVSQVVEKPITLEFVATHRAVIVPGLPYKLKIKATRWDDRPAADVRVNICRIPTKVQDLTQKWEELNNNPALASVKYCDETVTDGRGIARVSFTVSANDTYNYYRFQASLYNDSATSTSLQLPVSRHSGARAAFGPLSSDARSRTLIPLYLNLPTVDRAITVHFVVITKGGVIYRWGATTQCPTNNTADSYVHTAPRDSLCQDTYKYSHNYIHSNAFTKREVTLNIDTKNVNESNTDNYSNHNNIYRESNAGKDHHIKYNNFENSHTKFYKDSSNIDRNLNNKNDNPKEKVRDFLRNESKVNNNEKDNEEPFNVKLDSLLRVMLPIRITHQMCPDSHLIAYFYYNGELISASKHLEVEDCFSIKVDLTWLTRQVSPKFTASLQISTSGPSLCALSVLDTAAKWQQKTASPRDVVLEALRRMLADHRNITAFDALGHCYGESENNEDRPANSMYSTARWFARAGVRLVGGVHVPTCAAPAPASLLVPAQELPRTDFAEAWLWRLVTVGSNGTITVSARAPDSITRYEASAICVSKNGIGIAHPASMQVFREFFLHVDVPRKLRRGDTTILKYRLFNYLYKSLPVQIEVSTGPLLQIVMAASERACVTQRTSVSRRLDVRSVYAGVTRVRVRATVVADEDGLCGNNTDVNNSDEVIIQIEVEPEGIPVEEYHSALLCARDSDEVSPSQVTWKWTKADAVPGTETWRVWALGDITGPLLADADGLVSLPRGCGEQNMARLATNLLALHQLDPDSSAAAVALNHVATGFSRQLQYAHPSGGFSAFGDSHSAPSTWLTAFTVRYLRRAYRVLAPTSPVPGAVTGAETWLLAQQMENGCFRNEGQLFHRELKGGLGEDGDTASVALTAYVISSLVEGEVTIPVRVLRSSLSCFRALPPITVSLSGTRIYAHALVTYTLMRLRKYETDLAKRNEASLLLDKNKYVGAGLQQDEELKELVALLKVAKRSDGFVWWETGNLASSIEATGYGLLALSSCPVHLRQSTCATDARAAIRWLSTHRSPTGGFQSTQDTLVALEGLLSWSSLPSSPPNLTVTASSQSANITPTSQTIPVSFKVKPSEDLKVHVEGSGCALVVATRSYNSPQAPPASRTKELSVQVSVHTDGPFHCNDDSSSCYCAARLEVCAVWTGSMPLMSLMEVRLPGGFAADTGLLYHQLQPHTLLRRIETGASNNRITLYLGPRDDGDTTPARGGHYCVYLHAVGPKVRTRPAYARILDYYVPDINDTQIYTIPEDCPPSISHDTLPDIGPDNIFNNARSLSDDSEIIISDEFTFDNIPEGIPLEDPLYDNLTQKDEDSKSYNKDKEELGNDNFKQDIKDSFPPEINLNDTEGYNMNERLNIQTGTRTDIGIGIKRSYNIEDNKERNPTANISLEINHQNENYKEEIAIDYQVPDDTKAGSTDKRNTVIDELKPVGEVSTEPNPRQETDQFSNFHIISSETDLEVPTGVEGPIPSVVLPPDNFNSEFKKGNPIPLNEFYAQTFRGYAFNPYSQAPYKKYENR